MIRSADYPDAISICSIYNLYVANTTITFEEKPVSIIEMESRIKDIIPAYPWLVYEENGKILGYTYAHKWKERSAYKYSVESGIYIDPDHLGKGIGTGLKRELLKVLKEKSIHTVICGIALPNSASIALCEKFGFEKVAHFKNVGYKLDKWIDVAYWQLIL
jgi:phosphinothricin acetyltransferase